MTTATRVNAQVIGSTRLDLSDADPISAGEITRSVERFYRDFPKVAPCLTSVSLGDIGPHSYAATSMPALKGSHAFEILLNPPFYGRGTRELLARAVEQDLARGFHKFSQLNGNFEHELGHVLDGYLALQDPQGWYYSGQHIRFWDADSISGYAIQGGPAEAFAEAFANWREGIKPGNRTVTDALYGAIRAAGGTP